MLDLIGKGVFSDMVYAIMVTIEDILHNDRQPADSRSIHTLKRLHVFTKLLAQLAVAEWDMAQHSVNPYEPMLGYQADDDNLYNAKFKFYSVLPPPQDEQLVSQTLETLMMVRSTMPARHAAHHVMAPESNPDPSPKSAVRVDGGPNPAALVTEIDRSCTSIIFFLSASNWDQVYSFAYSKLRHPFSPVVHTSAMSTHSSASSTNSGPSHTPPPPSSLHPSPEEAEYGTLPAVDLFGILYLTAERAVQLLQDLQGLYHSLKRPLHRLALLHFSQRSLMYWLMCRGEEVVMETNSPDSTLCEKANTLFDTVYKHSDHEQRSHVFFQFLTTLLVLIPHNLDIADGSHSTPSTPTTPSTPSGVTRFKKTASFSPSLSSSGSSSHGRKLGFQDTLAKAFRKPPGSSERHCDKPTAATCYNIIAKAAASIYYVDTKHPTVVFALERYRDTLEAFFGSADRPSIFPRIDTLQSEWVSSYCLLNLHVLLENLIPVLKAPTAPVRYQHNIVRGFLNLHTLPFGEGVLYTMLTAHFGSIEQFLVMVTERLISYDRGIAKTDKYTYDLHVHSIKLAYLLLMTQPSLYLTTSEVIEDEAEIKRLEDAIVGVTITPERQLADVAIKYVCDVIDSQRLWMFSVEEVHAQPGHIVYYLFKSFGNSARAVSNEIVSKALPESVLEDHLNFIKRLLEARQEIVLHYRLKEYCGDDMSKIEKPEDRAAMSKTVETALLLSLCFNSTKVCKLALSIFSVVVREAALIENVEKITNSQWALLPSHNIYSELSAPSYIVTGTAAVQKRLFKWMQLLDDPSPAMIKAWAVIYDRWILISAKHLDGPNASTDTQRDWRTYCGFLCSVLSPLLNQGGGTVKIPDNVHFKARQFLGEFTQLLFSSSPFVRETVRDVFSRNASPLVFHHLFKTLGDRIDGYLTSEDSKPSDGGALGEKTLLLLNQTTILMTQVIQRLNDGDMYLSVDVGSLARKIVKILKTSPGDVEHLKLEIRLCQLLEIMGIYKDSLTMKHEVRTRNEFVMILAEWLEKATSYQTALSSGSSDRSTDRSFNRHVAEKERLIKDKSVALVKALNHLLDKLPLDVPDAGEGMMELESKAEYFRNLFSMFLRVLHRCKIEEEGRAASGVLQFADRIPVVRNQTILCLTHLLNSNVDIGLKVALPLGLHEDLSVRLAFLEIFKNILTQGTKFSEEYNESKRLEEMVDLVLNNRQLALTLCDICPANEVDEFSLAILSIFESRNKALELVKEVVTREIEVTQSAEDMLRRNCVATKILYLYASTQGYQFLRTSIGPLLKNMVAKPDEYVFEIEPDRLDNFEEFRNNLENFERCLTEFVDALQNAIDKVPAELREVCSVIYSTVEARFSDAASRSVGGFFFLRYVCPALVAPEGMGLLDDAPPKNVRRSLLLLAKIIQNMASGSTARLRLTFVSDKLELVEQKTKLIMLFLRSISKTSNHSLAKVVSSNPTISIGDKSYKAYVSSIHRFLYLHWEDAHHKILMEQRMRRLMVSRETYGDKEARVEDDEDDVSRQLTLLIRSLGRPSNSYSRAIQANLRQNMPPKLSDLLNRGADSSSQHDDEIEKKRLVHEGTARDGTPVLIMTARNYVQDHTDSEYALYKFFHVASKMWSDKFYIMYDCTGYKPENALPASTRSSTDAMIPDEMSHNCAALYIYNPGTSWLPRLKGLLKHYENGLYLNPLRTQYHFLTAESIQEHFNVNQLNLDGSSSRVVGDARVVYPDVNRFHLDKHKPEEVVVKIGSEFLQITAANPMYYVPDSPCYTNDVLHLSEIRDVSISSSKVPNTFSIYTTISPYTIVLQHEKRNEIIRAIVAAKSRLKQQESDPGTGGESIMTVDDAIATLLNMGLANLCYSQSAVQQAAYNLLAALPKRFDFAFGRELRGGQGLAIPRSEITMAVAFSESVAASHPHLTYDFIREAFAAYKVIAEESRQGLILFTVPWIKNIYQHVYLADEEKGPTNTASLIRLCLDLTFQNKADYNCFLLNVWPPLCLEESLVDVLIDEVVAYVAEQGLDDDSMEDVLAIITGFPTISICGTVLARIRELLTHPMPATEKSLVAHPSWLELSVLVRMMSYLSFESLLIAEVYLPEIFLIVTTFLYTASFPFRASLHSLLLNVVHAFCCSPKLPQERKDHLLTIWDDLNSPRGKLLFGISEETRHLNYDYLVLSAVKHIESCCSMLLDIMTTVGTVDEANVWRGRWSTFVMKGCFVHSPAVQCRSVLVLGCLARLQVEDIVVAQVVGVLRDALASSIGTLSEKYTACALFCLTKMVSGLPANSKYPAKLFWLAVSLLRGSSSTVFGYALALMRECLTIMDEFGTFKFVNIAEYLISWKDVLEGEGEEIFELTGIKFGVDNFDTALCATILGGLEKSVTRASTLDALETCLEVSAKNYVMDRDSKKHYPAYICYLYLLFLGCRSQADMRDLLWVAGYPDNEMSTASESDAVPMLLQEFLSEDSTDSTIALFLGVLLFQSAQYENMDMRFLETLKCVSERNDEKRLMIYSIARRKLVKILEQGSNTRVIQSMYVVAGSVLSKQHMFPDVQLYRRRLEGLLVSSGFESLVREDYTTTISTANLHEDDGDDKDTRQHVYEQHIARLLEHILPRRD